MNHAKERKKLLEPLLYDSFILVSQQFKALVQSVTIKVSQAKVYDWPDDEQIKAFYDFLSSLFDAENSIPRVSLMFNLMMVTHKPDVTWLDEIAEALKNSAEGLNSYL